MTQKIGRFGRFFAAARKCLGARSFGRCDFAAGGEFFHRDRPMQGIGRPSGLAGEEVFEQAAEAFLGVMDPLGEPLGSAIGGRGGLGSGEAGEQVQLNRLALDGGEAGHGGEEGFAKLLTVILVKSSRLGGQALVGYVVRTDEVSFYPSALTKGPQVERALNLAVAEMYIQGVSTRRVEPILRKLVGHGISSATVSKAAAELDETPAAWGGVYSFTACMPLTGNSAGREWISSSARSGPIDPPYHCTKAWALGSPRPSPRPPGAKPSQPRN